MLTSSGKSLRRDHVAMKENYSFRVEKITLKGIFNPLFLPCLGGVLDSLIITKKTWHVIVSSVMYPAVARVFRGLSKIISLIKSRLTSQSIAVLFLLTKSTVDLVD